MLNTIGGGSGGDGPVVLATVDPLFPSGRVLTAGNNIVITDGGAGGDITVEFSGNIDGGSAASIYLTAQSINGGNA